MRKKGFTLIELLGVIIILGIILLIASPTIKNMTKKSKEELYKIQINNIRDGLKNWAIDNNRLLPENEGKIITITLGQLKMGGYIDSDLKNPKTNKCFGNDMLLTVKRYQKNYLYTVDEESGTEIGSCDEYIKPYIILNGDSITYVEFGDTYADLGVVAKDASGNNITSSVTTTITGSGSTVDTSAIGNKYTITYSVTSGDDTASINRTVIVRDTTAPVITMPGNVVLDITTTSFDVMEGVSATDNSGETIEVTAKSNISFGIPGTYTITYTTKDSSGNLALQKRIVEVSNLY